MTICYFGDYLADYARSRVLIKGLRQNGAVVLECHSAKRGLAKYWELYKKHKEIRGKYDILIVGQSVRSRLVWLAKLLSDKKIVWDAFYSFYDKYVYDSQLISRKSLRARYYWLMEKFAGQLADLILLDTNEHIKYFSREFGLDESKFVKVLVGTDIDINGRAPAEKKTAGQFLVHFHGKYIPLQGVKYIIQAAKLLERETEIKFNLIGRGQTWRADKELADGLNVININFIDSYLPFGELVSYMEKADVCLGIFGDTPKASRVIPNKVYEAVALKKPVICAKTPAIQEFFIDRQDILLCQPANPKDLAEKILELKNNSVLSELIAKNAYLKFKKYATPFAVVKNLIGKLKE